MPPLRYVDLFAGAGGLSLGLERAGFRLAHAVEIDEHARASFLANRPKLRPSAVSRDIQSIIPGDIPSVVGSTSVDLVAGGPPCQGFSEVGKRNGLDNRNHLFRDFVNWVEALQPRIALFENVRGMQVTAGGQFLRAAKQAFARIGYSLTEAIFSASEFGVPQLRRRLVIFACRDDADLIVPPAIPPSPRTIPSVMDAIGDLPPVAAGEEASRYTRDPTTVLQQDLREPLGELTEHRAVPHPEWLVRAISHIPDGGNRRDIPDELQPTSGYHNSYARLRSDQPAVAVTSNLAKPSSARCIHPFQHRGLTTREGARLQTFPDSYIFCGGDVAKRLQIGNAVPPYMGEALGLYLRKAVWGQTLTKAERMRLCIMANGSASAHEPLERKARTIQSSILEASLAN
jgi:DNA (cytosine-5)-methyltransferase 1